MFDAEQDKQSGLIHAATNEYVLLAYRFVTAGCALLMTWWVFDLKVSTQDLTRQFHASLIASEARLGKLEGAVSVIDNSVRMNSRSIETSQSGMQQLWNRLYEISQARPVK